MMTGVSNLDHEKNSHSIERNREARKRKCSMEEMDELGVWDIFSRGEGGISLKVSLASYIFTTQKRGPEAQENRWSWRHRL